MGFIRNFAAWLRPVSPAEGLLWSALLLPAGIAAFTVMLIGHRSPGEAAEYSAYKDPEKPVISYLLSSRANADAFQREFGLSDREMEKVLDVVRKENGALERFYAQSEKIVEASKGRSESKIGEKITASGYHEKVRRAIARTKSGVEKLLPEHRRAELADWVDNQWREEVRAFGSEAGATYQTSATRRHIIFKVYATQYNGYSRFEVALPHRKLKFDGGYRVHIRYARGRTGKCTQRRTWAPVREVGPWNTYDNYWQARRYRTMWRNLRRGLPQAQAAFFHNYNGGKDEKGREVLNPAGIDLTPAVARKLGLRHLQNAWVCVYYPWVSR